MKRDVAFQDCRPVTVHASHGAAAGQGHSFNSSYNAQLMACGDIDGDGLQEVIVCDFEGVLFAIKDAVAYPCELEDVLIDGSIMVLEVFAFVDESQAEIILLDNSGLLLILCCDLFETGEAATGSVILRQILAQDLEVSNATAIKACKTYDKNVSILICANRSSINFFVYDPIELQLVCVHRMSDSYSIKNIVSIDAVYPYFLACGSSTGSISVLHWSLQSQQRPAVIVPANESELNRSVDTSEQLQTADNSTVLSTAIHRQHISSPLSLSAAPGLEHQTSSESALVMTMHVCHVPFASKSRAQWQLPTGAAQVVSLCKAELTAVSWRAITSEAHMSTVTFDDNSSTSTNSLRDHLRMPSLPSMSSMPSMATSMELSINNDSHSSAVLSNPPLPLASLPSCFFAVCWGDGTISVCRIAVDDASLATCDATTTTSADRLTYCWLNMYTVQTPGTLYKIDRFTECVFPCESQWPQWLPRGTILATSISGHSYLVCLSEVWAQSGLLQPPSSAGICNLQKSSVLIDRLNGWGSESTPETVATVFCFDFKLYMGNTTSRNFCSLLNPRGRNVQSVESDGQIETAISRILDWRIYNISSMNQMHCVSSIQDFLLSIGSAQLPLTKE